MLKREKTAEIKKDKELNIGHLTSNLKRPSNKEKRTMPLIEGINKVSEQIKKLPRAAQPVIPSREMWVTFIGSILGIGITSAFAFYWNCPMLLGPLGATAVLVYGAYKAPLAQPRNVLLGHLIGAFMGVAVYDFFGVTWWSLALGVTLAIVFMMATYSVHPPAGATAYVAVQSGGLGVGYMYLLNPVLFGALTLLLVAVIVNKLGKRDYPTHWW